MHKFTSHPSFSPSTSSRHLARLVVLAASVLLTLTACEKQPVTVGALLPLTGEDAAIGQSTRQGMELAQEELQKQGRANGFVFAFEDSTSNADVALERYEALLANKSVLTVGGITPDEARALVPLAEERERVLLSPTAYDQELGAANRYFYRLAPSAAVTGTTIATFAAEDLKLDSMVLVAQSKHQGDLLEEGLGSTFDRNGGEMLGRFDLDDATLDWALEEIGRMRPDAVTLAGWGGWLAETVGALKKAGYRGKIFAPESFASPSVREAAGSAARGVLVAGGPFDAGNATGDALAFVEAYRARYGSDPDVYAAAGWDTVLVLDAALTDRPNLPGEARQWMRDDVKDIAGVIGHLQFNETGAATRYPRIYSVQKDLGLMDHSRWLEQEKQRIADQKRKLEEERQRILRQMSQSQPQTVPQSPDDPAAVDQVASSG